jgi:predicted Rossmann fold nucleotide-binding protein DprA/Smf involved in DNA uptake
MRQLPDPAGTQLGIRKSHITPSDIHWPRQLTERLRADAPVRLWAIGKLEILATRKVGLFCSVHCPDSAVPGAYDAARKLRDNGVTVVSGFHSPVEKECLRILLEGSQSIIICPPRALEKVRLSAEWRQALNYDRLLLLSAFEKPRRADKESARKRNELVAALSDEVLIIHAAPRGGLEELSQRIDRWGVARRPLQQTSAMQKAE